MKCFSYCDHKISLQYHSALNKYQSQTRIPPHIDFQDIWKFPIDSSNTQKIKISLKGQPNWKMNLD